MRAACLTPNHWSASPWSMIRWLVLGLAGWALSACVTVKAPDKPIEINLNINVKQEVVVSLRKDAEDFIANNPDLFPK
jgi:hypothetical protein